MHDSTTPTRHHHDYEGVQMSITSFDMPRTDRILAGAGSRSRVGEELDRLRAERVALITSPTVSGHSCTQDVREEIGSRLVLEFAEVKPHPPTEQLVELISRARVTQPDVYVAVGAGSVVDSAKFAALGVAENIT